GVVAQPLLAGLDALRIPDLRQRFIRPRADSDPDRILHRPDATREASWAKGRADPGTVPGRGLSRKTSRVAVWLVGQSLTGQSLRLRRLRDGGRVLTGLGGDRQVNGERGSLAFLGADRQAAVHAADELAADVEAQTGAADAACQPGVDPVELAEDPPLLERRNADALVADGNANTAVARLDRDLDAAAVGRVLDRVVDQVDQHLAKPVGIAGNRIERLRD